jgi:hypothetical protein
MLDESEKPNMAALITVPLEDGGWHPEPKFASGAHSMNAARPSRIFHDLYERIMTWAIVGMPNSLQFWRIVPNGLAASILVICGMQLWIIGIPKHPEQLHDPGGWYFDARGPLDCVNYVWEAIVSRPGDRLYVYLLPIGL